ncbi:DUF6155 family protein [Clostridium aestuarii]|uniref:DUF6155 family protein n=1 Tax=Clostridium aestuarii TaxID=338193 RepID=A0ABT4CWH6_9CLOT|nr:DUF6155 family protein [Clostridium aestuarii]MCY6483349.1 DUF6155 family protein [Clostridium aestuarii]
MNNINIYQLNEHIDYLSKDELKEEVIELFKFFTDVKEYYSLKINPELEEKILEKYKKIIKEEFFPHDGEGKMRYSVVSKAIMDFQRITSSKAKTAELMLYYVENALKFMNYHGNVQEEFYINIEGVFDKALNYISKNNLEDQFHEKVGAIVEKSKEIGFEFMDSMIEIFDSYYTI